MSADCGFCYVSTESELAVNGSCLAAQRDVQGDVMFSESAYGRCHGDSLHSPLHWAYSFCPTQFAWMATFGLVVYLMFFALGMSHGCILIFFFLSEAAILSASDTLWS